MAHDINRLRTLQSGMWGTETLVKVRTRRCRPTERLALNWIIECSPPPHSTTTLMLLQEIMAERAARCMLSLRTVYREAPKSGGEINIGYHRNLKPLAPTTTANIKPNPTPSQININTHTKSLLTSVPIIQYKPVWSTTKKL